MYYPNTDQTNDKLLYYARTGMVIQEMVIWYGKYKFGWMQNSKFKHTNLYQKLRNIYAQSKALIKVKWILLRPQ